MTAIVKTWHWQVSDVAEFKKLLEFLKTNTRKKQVLQKCACGET